jgi:hypothetical protein
MPFCSMFPTSTNGNWFHSFTKRTLFLSYKSLVPQQIVEQFNLFCIVATVDIKMLLNTFITP